MDARERAKRLRRLGVRGTIAAFVAAWAIVFGQLVIGHDPALSKQKTAQTRSKSKSQPSQAQLPTPAPATSSQS